MYFGQIKQEKIVFLLFWIKKSFLHQKKKLLKKSKNSKFSKRVSPWFLSKNRTFCHLCLLGKSSQKRSFFGILDKKECFLDQKKEVLKNDKKSTFSKGVSPQFLSKNWTFYHLCFLGKSRQRRSFWSSGWKRTSFKAEKGSFKNSKIRNFPKGLVHAFYQKIELPLVY